MPLFDRNTVFTVLISVTLLTGCGEALEQRLAADPKLQEPETNNPTSSPTSPQGSTPEELPPQSRSEIPDNIPIYNNAEVVTEQTNPETNSGEIELTSVDDRQLITDFYEQELNSSNWEIVTPVTENSNEIEEIIAQSASLELTVTISNPSNRPDLTNIIIAYQPREEETPSETVSSSNNPQTFTDLEKTPDPLVSYVRDVAKLGILSAHTPENEKATSQTEFAPNEPVTRRTFARWLFRANNKFYSDRASLQIRPVQQAQTPAFQDIPPNDPDFPIIQGLAEAGLIPSRLTGDATATRFRPDAPLTRETLLLWKVPLDTRSSLPTVNVNTVKETWGFQDASKIDSAALSAVVEDFSNGERSNIRRLYGYTQLLQPNKTVTRAEAAAALWSFGTQGEAISAEQIQ